MLWGYTFLFHAKILRRRAWSGREIIIFHFIYFPALENDPNKHWQEMIYIDGGESNKLDDSWQVQCAEITPPAMVFISPTIPSMINATLHADIYIHIVVCHLPEGSKIRWREDMGGGLTSAREPHVGWSLQPVELQIPKLPGREKARTHKSVYYLSQNRRFYLNTLIFSVYTIIWECFI